MRKPLRFALLSIVLLLSIGAAFFISRNVLDARKSQASSTSVTVPTATTVVTPTPDLAIAAKACGIDPTTSRPGSAPYAQIGDLLFTKAQLGPLTYAGIKLPDNLTHGQPYHQNAQTSALHPGNELLANPSLGGGAGSSYEVTVCNTSKTTAHVLQTLAIKIASLTPDTSANINVEVGCDGSYSTVKGIPVAGCGGAYPPGVEAFQATWPQSIAVGTVATIKQTDDELSQGNPDPTIQHFGEFPVTLQPGKVIALFIGMDYPQISGTYTFAFGIQTDTNALEFAANTTSPIFLAKNAYTWSGNRCNQWKNQIPTAATEQFYLCPAT